MARYLVAVALATALCGFATAAASGAPITYGPIRFVDDQLAGGEPLVMEDTKHHTLIYTSHEGTTHLYRGGITSPLPFLTHYTNQVNVWYSKDNGKTWHKVAINPATSQGFSDPDLTQDAGGRIYDTGIDLANDALFSSPDGGVTWDKGTSQCHNGDRPWLAGAGRDQVFLATDTAEGSPSHEIFESTDGGQTCSSTGIPDGGSTPDGGTYTGYGKLYWNPRKQMLVEPVIYSHAHGDRGIGASTWRRGMASFKAVEAVKKTTLFGHFPITIYDRADVLYLIWDTDPRVKGTTGGCDGEPTPATNQIVMSVSPDFGRTWSRPEVLAAVNGHRVFWPWAVAGNRGELSVVYYQTDRLADIDCQDSSVTIHEARVTHADRPGGQHIVTTTVTRQPIHQGSTVCQGGTTCVATGQDRRLGDFFTNSLDRRGCVMIASGDTTRPDTVTGGPRPISLPILIRQTAGPGLLGQECGNSTPVGCRDRLAPVSTITVLGLRRTGVRTRGRAVDVGCHGRVDHVNVAVLRYGRDKDHCRFLLAGGHLGATTSCHRRVWQRARGTTRWSFSERAALPRGRYEIRAQAVDAAGNRERRRRQPGDTVVRDLR